MTELPLPKGLTQLLASGVWPSATGPSLTKQQLKPLVAPELVRRFADDESLICLCSPPFLTVAQCCAGGERDFWEGFGVPDQINPDLTLVIGDFGLGSDSPIILDYARDLSDPPVLRLRWNKPPSLRLPWKKFVRTEWVQGARNFDEFAKMLGLDL